jgi:hypothetical protein
MQKSAATLGGGVQAWFVGADKTDRFTFPKELLAARSARIAVGIAHYRPKGSPWGAYGALIVTSAGQQMVAKGGAEGRAVF